MLFFGLVYVVEGIGQTGGLIAQPLNYYLKQTFGWTAVQVTAYLTILNLPWIIKPVYGIISDFFPLFGRRRFSYLVLTSSLAAAAGPALVLLLVFMTGCGIMTGMTAGPKDR